VCVRVWVRVCVRVMAGDMWKRLQSC